MAVARRRIMVLGAARASRYGVLPLRQGPAGWGSARAPPPRFSGGAAGRASSGGFGTRVDSQCGGERRQWQPEKPEFAESMVRWFKHRRNSSALVVTGGSRPQTPRRRFAEVARRNGDRAPRAGLGATGADEPAEAMSTTMRGTGSAQVHLIHSKEPTTPAAAASAPLTRSPPAPAATPRRRCSVETG